jgi:hypothetical protein
MLAHGLQQLVIQFDGLPISAVGVAAAAAAADPPMASGPFMMEFEEEAEEDLVTGYFKYAYKHFARLFINTW